MAGLSISPELRTQFLNDPLATSDAERSIPVRRRTVATEGVGEAFVPAFTARATLPPPKVTITNRYPGGTGGTGGAPGTGGGGTVPTTPYFYQDPLSSGGYNPFAPGGSTLPGGTQTISGIPCYVLTAFGFPCTSQGAAAAIASGIRSFTGGDSNNQPGAAASCPEGYQVDPQTGICNKTGIGGAVQRYLPGGKTGTLADQYGEAVIGAFGIPALVPAQVGTITKRDGSTGAVLRCPPGAVLGKDDLCYMKGSIPRQFRKWRPDAKCPISRKDLQAVKAIGRVQKRIKALASDAGLSTRRK